MFVVRPGYISTPRNLDLMLASSAESFRRSRIAERERRTANGVPLSDADWRIQVGQIVGDLRVNDRDDVRAKAQLLLAATADEVEVPEPYIPSPDLATVYVRIRHISHVQFQGMLERISISPSTTPAERAAAIQSQAQAIRDFVADTVAEVSGLEVEVEGKAEPLVISGRTRLSQEDLDVLADNGLLFHLFVVARDFQQLTGEEKKAFGRPPR